jgi:nucleoside-diphosphate-sugar epimerase
MSARSPIAVVTGAPGWLGTRLVQTLIAGLPDVPELSSPASREVRCLVLPGQDTSELSRLGAKLVEGDVGDPPSLARLFDGAEGATVFHSAGVVHPTRGVRQLFQVNAAGTRNVVAAAAQAGARRLVHVSSNSPLGCNRSPDALFDETSPYHPYMAYGRSKMQAELAVRAAPSPLEWVIIRPPWFYGPNQPPRQTLFFHMIRDGKFPLVGGGTSLRSMAYIDNICQGLLRAERVAAAAGNTYWIADREPYRMRDVVATVAQVLEQDFNIPVKHKQRNVPGFLSDVARLVDRALQALGIYQQKIHVLSEMNQHIAGSIAKAERELGYAPTVALREGMRRSLQWLLDRNIKL